MTSSYDIFRSKSHRTNPLIMSEKSKDAFDFAFYDNETFAHIIFGRSAANLMARIAFNRCVVCFCVGMNLTTVFSVLGPDFVRCAELWQWEECTDQMTLRVVFYNLIVRLLIFTPWLSCFGLLWNKEV